MLPREIVFILVPNFSMIALFSALEPLRVANRFIGDVFRWRFISIDGAEVVASNAIPVSVSASVDEIGRPDMAIICASYDHEAAGGRRMSGVIRLLARNGVTLAGVDTGAFLLAGAGVLDGYKATCHWETLAAFSEIYPNVDVVEKIHVIDRGRMTASGGASAMDMMLDWLAAISGEELATKTADMLVVTRRAEQPGDEKIPMGARRVSYDKRVIGAITLMENHIEDVLQISDIAADCGVSQRQLDRLFKADLGIGPKAYYLQLRLERAQRLLCYSRMRVRDVALASGFNSLEQFSRSYKIRYGFSASRYRAGHHI